MSRVRSRWVVTVCGSFLVLLGLIPKVGAIVSDLPGPVIGGAAGGGPGHRAPVR